MALLQVLEGQEPSRPDDSMVARAESRRARDESQVPDGIKAGLAFALPTLAIGMSFGVLAEPVMGGVAAIVMSILVFAGAAQFASVSILAAGGSLASAVSAGLLVNARFLPMGLAVAPALRGGPRRRAIGVFGGAVLGDPAALGLDAIFPAFYLALLAEEMNDRAALSSAVLGAAIALVLVPFTPPGIPVIAASAAALLGLRSR
jgi:predicted branched-subunit amino acid permease